MFIEVSWQRRRMDVTELNDMSQNVLVLNRIIKQSSIEISSRRKGSRLNIRGSRRRIDRKGRRNTIRNDEP